MALSRPLQPRDRRKRPARKGRAKAACAKTNTDWQLRKVRKILDTTPDIFLQKERNSVLTYDSILSIRISLNSKASLP